MKTFQFTLLQSMLVLVMAASVFCLISRNFVGSQRSLGEIEPMRFDGDLWQIGRYRFDMALWLSESGFLDGKSLREVEELLGAPETTDGNANVWYSLREVVKVGYRGTGEGHLVISLDDRARVSGCLVAVES